MGTSLVSLAKLGDSVVGHLSVIEAQRTVPFDIKRIYYIYSVPQGGKRGMHAHRALEQLLWCPYGAIEVVLDNGELKQTHSLDSPHHILFVGPGVWHHMHWRKEGSVLCVAASDYYDEGDYIRDYAEFLTCVREGYWDDES